MINILKNTYYRLKQINDDIGLVAIRNISENINPFKNCYNIILRDQYVKLTNNDIKDLDDEVKKLLKNLYDGKYYYIPYHGLNSMNIYFYIKIDPLNYNIKSSKTIREIKYNEELIIDKIDFSKFKITDKKQNVIKNLKKTYCKLGKSYTHGVGVITIKDIPKNTNPFIITDNRCYNYNGIQIKKKLLEQLDSEILKMIYDFISPLNDLYYIPSYGIDSLNITFYLNNSLDPNLSVISDGCEYLGFKTKRNIHKGEELFINYEDYKTYFNEIID